MLTRRDWSRGQPDLVLLDRFFFIFLFGRYNCGDKQNLRGLDKSPELPVFQITFKGRVPTRRFEGSIDVVLATSSQVYHCFCWVRWLASFLAFLT